MILRCNEMPLFPNFIWKIPSQGTLSTSASNHPSFRPHFNWFLISEWCSNDGMTSEWQGWEWKNAIFSRSSGIAQDDQNEPGMREIGIPRSFSSFRNKVIPRSSQTTQNDWNDIRMIRMTSEWWNEIGMNGMTSEWWYDVKMTSEWVEWHRNEKNDIGMMKWG